MSKFLFIHSSIRGSDSVSSQLAGELKRKAEHEGHAVVTRDLGAAPLPALDADLLGALFTSSDARNAAQAAQAARVDTLIAELQAADVVVLAAGMYNFGMPTQLKTWFDHVLQAGRTFRYTAAGPEGLVKNKRAVVLAATGGVYGNDNPADHMVPHIRQMLAFIGITELSVVRAEGMAMGEEAAKQGVQAGLASVEELALA